MKITVNTTVTREIELPLYFKESDYYYYMTIGEKSALRVVDFPISESLVLFPKIEIIALDIVAGGLKEIQAISETEFKLVFTTVTNRIESLLN